MGGLVIVQPLLPLLGQHPSGNATEADLGAQPTGLSAMRALRDLCPPLLPARLAINTCPGAATGLGAGLFPRHSPCRGSSHCVASRRGPTTFQPPERVLEAESPRNTIVQLETPVKIRVARRKSIEPPTLLRRGEWPNAWDPRMNATLGSIF